MIHVLTLPCFGLKEWLTIVKLVCPCVAVYPGVTHITEESGALFQTATDEHWGADCSKLMETISVYDFNRHFQIARTTGYRVDLFIGHALIEGLTVEKTGNIQHCLDYNDQRYRAAESYVRAAPPAFFEMCIYLWSRCSFIGVEAHHQHLQPRRDFLQHFQYTGINNIQQVGEGIRSSAEWAVYRSFARSSADGLHHMCHEHAVFAFTRAMLSFLVGTGDVELNWLDDLPPADAPTMHCTHNSTTYATTPRVLVAEVFEQQGRHAEAIQFAQTDLQDFQTINMLSKVRAGRVLGRCHAALGQHMLSVSAFDAAIDLAHSRKLLLSEALSVRGRAAAGRNGAGNSGLHWNESTGKQRLAEVMGRMQGSPEALETVLGMPQW
jgi:hypothetical protein